MGQICIIPKPELFGSFGEDFQNLKLVGVASLVVVWSQTTRNCKSRPTVRCREPEVVSESPQSPIVTVTVIINYLEPQTTIYKWLFQLDDSQSLHKKWLFHQTSIKNWLFRVPGRS